MCPDLLIPLNMIAGGVLLLVVIGIIAGIGLWYAYHEGLALVDQLCSTAQGDDAPGLSSPQLVWSATPPEEPEPVERMGSSVNWPPDPLWPDTFRQQSRPHDEEDED